jgi:hypothetical protein
MLVFGIFGAFLATTVVQTTRLSRESVARETTAQRASVLMGQVTRDLRTAVRVGPSAPQQTAFVSAQADSVSFYSSVAPVVAERLYVPAASTILWRQTQRPDDGSVYPDMRYTDTSRISAGPLVAPDLPHTVTFAYLLKGSSTPVPSVTTLVDRQAIVAVQVRVSVDGDGPGRLRPVVLESTVRPYNT